MEYHYEGIVNVTCETHAAYNSTRQHIHLLGNFSFYNLNR